MVKKQDRFELKGSVSAQFSDDPWFGASLDKSSWEIDGVLPRWARCPSSPAMRLLADNLSRIFDTRYPDNVRSNRREQYASALVQLTDFLEANDFPPLVVNRFIQLNLALRRLDEGEVDEWLERAPRHWKRHFDQPSVWRARVLAVIALEVLAEDSPGALERHSAWVAKRYQKLFPDEKVSSAAVKKWRERFKKEVIHDWQATGLFNNREAVIKCVRDAMAMTQTRPTPTAIAETILTLAPD